MRTTFKLAAVFAFVALTSYAPAAAPPVAATAAGPSLQSLGPLYFNADGTMFAADTNAATIFALDLGAQATTGQAGTADVADLTGKIAAMLGTDAKDIAITDLAVHPKTHNSYVSVMRGQGPAARPALLKVDGAGKLTLVSMDTVQYTSVALPNPPAADAEGGRGQRANSVTAITFTNGRVFVAGLSNEEFASKLWSIGYPFTKADQGTSVEIWHTDHRRLETRAPIYAMMPMQLDNNQPFIVAAYTCTPFVKFQVSALKAGEKFSGTTIGEFGAGNRPLDMIRYQKDGKDYILMANTSRGIMKVATAPFATATPLTAPITTETGGVPYETIKSMTGVLQLGMLDATHAVTISGANNGPMNLSAVALP